MNDYIAVTFTVQPPCEAVNDVLAALLCDIGYESFVTDDDMKMTAYVRKKDFSTEAVDKILVDFPLDARISYASEVIEGQDWNSEWEKNYFKPIVVADRCVVHSSFHTDVPVAEYDIVIDPKMAFGTGHHDTTSLMMTRLIDGDIFGCNVVDMGTGSGILAILAALRGAACVKAIEIDPMAYVNTVENVSVNNVQDIVEVTEGDASMLPDIEWADIFMANINRNIILCDLDRYAASMRKGARLWLSGFYEKDVQMITDKANALGLKYTGASMSSKWASAAYVKE